MSSRVWAIHASEALMKICTRARLFSCVSICSDGLGKTSCSDIASSRVQECRREDWRELKKYRRGFSDETSSQFRSPQPAQLKSQKEPPYSYRKHQPEPEITKPVQNHDIRFRRRLYFGRELNAVHPDARQIASMVERFSEYTR